MHYQYIKKEEKDQQINQNVDSPKLYFLKISLCIKKVKSIAAYLIFSQYLINQFPVFTMQQCAIITICKMVRY